ncbi:MAG: hypothetical protein IT211_06220 [Armatimonadetes bacterium]|nr:hypothetical protein [Armatimonadota bacterium]
MSARDTKLDYAGDDLIVREFQFTPQTAAFASGDVLCDLTELFDCVVEPGGTGYIRKIEVFEKAGSSTTLKKNIQLLLFNATLTVAAINAAFTLTSETDLAKLVHTGTTATSPTWLDVDTGSAGTAVSCYAINDNTHLSHPFQCAAGSSSLYCTLVLREAATYTGSSKIIVRIHIARS